MFSNTLGLYFARTFIKNILLVFAICFAIIFFAELVERLRDYKNHEGFGVFQAATLAMFRTPTIAELVFPFAVLLGSIIAFLTLTRKLELAVTRAAGISIWQFALPGVAVALLFGIIASTIYNPLTTITMTRAELIELDLAEKRNKTSRNNARSFRTRDIVNERENIILADSAFNSGQTLTNMSVLTFDETGQFTSQIDANWGKWKDGYWLLNQVEITTASAPKQYHETWQIKTGLTPQYLDNYAQNAGITGFWSLPAAIHDATTAGLESHKLQFELYSFLAKPILFAAMVLIAATVSLRLTRLGRIGGMILTGILCGFMLYVLSELLGDLGKNAILNPIIAAWLPALLALMLSVTVLLYQEDG